LPKKSSFTSDRCAGDRAEELVQGVFHSAGLKSERNQTNQLSGWDIRFWGELNGTAEVKNDLYERKSGNVAIEYYNPRSCKPSGIAATKSDVWVIVLADQSVWVASSKELLEYIKSKPCLRDIPIAGDGNASLKLYRREELFGELFSRLDGLPPDGVLTTLAGRMTY